MTTINDRITRRIRTESARSVVHDQSALDPTTCPANVQIQGRGLVVEHLLDAIDPVFSGALPPTVYVWGPKGAGKSAVVSRVVKQLRRAGGHDSEALYTATRTQDVALPLITRVDLRGLSSEWAFYRCLLGTLVDERSVPSNGVSTETLRTRIRDHLEESPPTVVVTDHVGDSLAPETDDVESWLATAAPEAVWIGVGRRVPEALDVVFDRSVEVPAYQPHALVDVLTSRVDAGLSSGSITHDQLDAVAAWADGDVHDALTAVFEAAMVAHEAGQTVISSDHLDVAIDSVPDPCTSLACVFSLSDERQTLLYGLTAVLADGNQSVTSVAETLARHPSVDLRASTIERILYELADCGILRRVDSDPGETSGRGRPPSRLETRFPLATFARLYEGRSESSTHG
ncbi:Cdc6/Cdc18 family protein [Saliphagus sp. GCM10025308]